MSEKVKTTPVDETKEEATKKPAEKPTSKKEASKPVKEKKEGNFITRGCRKVKNGVKNFASNHPFWYGAVNGTIGAGLAIGAGYGGKKMLENRREKKAAATYIPQDPNDLDPNN